VRRTGCRQYNVTSAKQPWFEPTGRRAPLTRDPGSVELDGRRLDSACRYIVAHTHQ
jgi:hypothetical protein